MPDWVIGIDLGATKIALGLVGPERDASDGAHISARGRFPTVPAAGPESAVERMAQAVERLSAAVPDGGRLRAVGICTPGPIDFESGMLLDPPNLTGWLNVPLRQMLSARLGLPVALEHDAKASGLGEYYYGAGRDSRSMVYIVVGTGVGAAIIVDGRLYRGMCGSAGEVGHITIDPKGERCSCGSIGCVETFTSGPWLARRFGALLDRDGVPAAERPPHPITGETVTSLAALGDERALAVMDGAGEALATGIGALAMLFDIDLYVIGSSVSKCGDLLLGPARLAVHRHAYHSVAQRVRILCSDLGDDGPILGCAWLARQLLQPR
jgi:glucokinase